MQAAGVTRIVSWCYNLRGHDILLDYVALEVLSQIPWKYLKFQNVTRFRYFVLIVLFVMGIINIYSMWELCMGVRDFVLDHLNYIWMIIIPLLCLIMFITIFQSIILAICIPVQVIVIPLECNRNIPNINFRSHVALAVILGLFVQFVHCNVNYSHYKGITLFYNLWCAVWMILYCYPAQIRSQYHLFKQQLPNWTRPLLRLIRDRLVFKVWRNLRVVIKRRRRDENIANKRKNLWTSLCNQAKVLLLLVHVISCILVCCLFIRYHYAGWEIPSIFLYLMVCQNCYPKLARNVRNKSVSVSSCFASGRDTFSIHGAVEKFEMQPPIKCTEYTD